MCDVSYKILTPGALLASRKYRKLSNERNFNLTVLVSESVKMAIGSSENVAKIKHL